jgi:putative ABC transport system substrate-binding protein
MQRRRFIALVAGAATWPLGAGAQQKAVPTIGYMSGGSASFYAGIILPAFRAGLQDAGYVDCKNLTIEYRWAEGHYDRLPGFAGEFVRRHVDLIAATGGNLSPSAAKAPTSTIPIVFTARADPVAGGLVASMARPGGNVTGVSFLTTALYPKRLQLLSDAVPLTRSIAMLAYANGPNSESNLREAAAAAKAMGKKFNPLQVTTDADFEPAFASLASEKDTALVVQTDPFIDLRVDQIVGLAARYRIPVI